jgi:hypothetical protein
MLRQLLETPNTRKHPDRVDHEQLAALWRHLSELFQSREHEQAFNETVAVAVTLATDQQVLKAEAPTPEAIAEAEARAAGGGDDASASLAGVEAGGSSTGAEPAPSSHEAGPESGCVTAGSADPTTAAHIDKPAKAPPLTGDIGDGADASTGDDEELPKSATVSVSSDGRRRSGSQWSRVSIENMESNPHTETLTFKVFRAAVLSQPLMVEYFESPLPLRL